jgi:hypothetical protein
VYSVCSKLNRVYINLYLGGDVLFITQPIKEYKQVVSSCRPYWMELPSAASGTVR